jgi:hypothetical protein
LRGKEMDKELIKFIAMAKKKTYASLNSEPKRTKDGGKTYTVKKGDYTYTDTYFGNLIDCGQERVFLKGKVIWVMAYRGGIVEKYELLHKEAFNFLKECISKMPKDFPARGPRKLKKGKWQYENNWNGNIEGFTGEENIYFSGEKICFRNYVGGLIKNKK